MRYYMLLFGFIVTAAAHGQRLVPSALEIPIVGFGLFALEEFDGKLFIGGQFNSVNGAVMRSVVSWDGNIVEAVPGAFDNAGSEHVRALLAYQGGLIVAGQSAGLGHIARWDGESWTMLGGGLPARVNTLTVHAGGLVAGCQNGAVMRWDGGAWQPIGSPMNAAVLAVEQHQGELYAAGAFTASGSGPTLNRIARWSGTDWVPVGSGLNAPVNCLKSDVLGLLVGGAFSFDSDSTMQLPACARLQAGILDTIPGVSSGTQVTGFFRHPDGRLFIGGARKDGFEFDMNLVRVMREFNGHVFVAGGGSVFNAWRDTGTLAKLIPGSSTAEININDITATVTSHPSSFYKWWGSGRPGFEVPKGQGVHSVYSASPWIRGVANGQIHEATPWYHANSTNEGEQRHAGPRAVIMDDTFFERFHRTWKVDRAMIQAHIANWNAPGYSAPEPIASWPGNGLVVNGEPERIAPFMDANGNGIYEPGQGEYPIIKGTQAVYAILHTEPGTNALGGNAQPMPLDLHVMHYAYESSDEALRRTVFVNYRYVNRSTTLFDSVRFAQFADIDVGCWGDDFVGCDSTRNLSFTYNWDDFDESCMGALGYGPQPPAQGFRMLNVPMLSHRDYPREASYPINMNDLLLGLHIGQPFMNLGYPTHFQYPGGAWIDSDMTLVDRRVIAATGPFTLAPGDTLCIDLAFIYARAASGGAYASVEALKLRSDSVQSFYNAQGIACNHYPIMTSVREYATPNALHVFPNPASQQITVAGDSALGEVLVLDMQGRVVHRERTAQERITLDARVWAQGSYVVRAGEAVARVVKE
ncbi:MAG TPA: T9SS type A sorting domain-containing protein [Flavobacteriales bacterium]|nr:T9SS type A sorting domain-containing protein [Flavobacteriales bacterium]